MLGVVSCVQVEDAQRLQKVSAALNQRRFDLTEKKLLLHFDELITHNLVMMKVHTRQVHLQSASRSQLVVADITASVAGNETR